MHVLVCSTLLCTHAGLLQMSRVFSLNAIPWPPAMVISYILSPISSALPGFPLPALQSGSFLRAVSWSTPKTPLHALSELLPFVPCWEVLKIIISYVFVCFSIVVSERRINSGPFISSWAEAEVGAWHFKNLVDRGTLFHGACFGKF